MYVLYNHQTSSLSALDLRMVRHVPAGGNWKNIPEDVPSRRLEQIRRTGGRTTYYGRLRWDAPAYTINTYFNRPGNGTFIHPDDGSNGRPAQHRLISFREAARLQSFPDSYRFYGPKSALLKQIGNAVPPLLAYAVAKRLPPGSAAELFAGAGGLSLGFEFAGFSVITALDIDRHAVKTYAAHHPNTKVLLGDALDARTRDSFIEETRRGLANQELDVLIGGPPCQGFSTAGWRRSEDPRNRLWQSYMDVLAALRPRWLVLENVPGMKTMRTKDPGGPGRPVVEIVVEEFQNLGYSLALGILNAAEFGVPQRRRRLFIVGVRSDLGKAPTLPSALIEKPLSVRDAIGNLPPLGVADGQEVLVLQELPAHTLYQAWLQGEIDTSELVQKLPNERGTAPQPTPLFT